jgi:NAD(P)H-hydrate repair Nnr-like enzyme with NAD(P)H-hydrate dehydratase domain
VAGIYPGAGAHQDRLAVIDGDALSPSTLANVLHGADTLYCALTPHRL